MAIRPPSYFCGGCATWCNPEDPCRCDPAWHLAPSFNVTTSGQIEQNDHQHTVILPDATETPRVWEEWSTSYLRPATLYERFCSHKPTGLVTPGTTCTRPTHAIIEPHAFHNQHGDVIKSWMSE